MPVLLGTSESRPWTHTGFAPGGPAAVEATVATTVCSVAQGITIFRVHDVGRTTDDEDYYLSP